MVCTTRMNLIYSDSTAGAREAICLLARVQSPKGKEKLRWNGLFFFHTHLLSNIFMSFFKGMWLTHATNIIYKSAVVNKNCGGSAKIKAEKSAY